MDDTLEKIEEMSKKVNLDISITDNGYDVQIWWKANTELTDFFIRDTLKEAVDVAYEEYQAWKEDLEC